MRNKPHRSFMFFSFLFLSKGKFENSKAHKTYVVATSLTMFAVFASFALPFFTDVGAIADVRGGANVNSGEQLAFILKNPLRYARILFNFILQYVSLGNMSLNLVNYAYYGFSGLIYGTVGTLLIVFTALTDKEDDIYQDKKKHTVVTLFTALAQVALVATALYIAYTPVMHSTVNGCQYRYMFPILTPIFYFIGSSKIKNVISKKMSILIVFALSSLAMLGSLYDVYISKILALM